MIKKEDKMIEKIEIHQNYNFSTLSYYNSFSFNIRDKKAQCAYFPVDKKIPRDFYKSRGSIENYNVNFKFWQNNNYKLKYLTNDEIIDFSMSFLN